MTWQEDLRRLDVQLAGGEISLREHRKQREELLAAASGGFASSPVAATTEPVPVDEPPVSRSAALLATDRQTTAPSPADERATESMRYPTIHEAPTIVTRALGPLPDLTPPRSRRQVPPLPTHPVRRTGRKPTWAILALGVVLVLAMIIGATLFFSSRNEPDAPGSAVTGPAQTLSPSDAIERAEAKLPTLPGAANPENATLSIDKALELHLVTQADADLMRAAGASEIIYRASSDPANSPNGAMLLVVPASSAAQATKLADALRENLAGTGFVATPLGPAGADLMYTGSNAQGRVGALWYPSSTLAVGMGVSQSPTGDPAQLRTRLEQIRTQVTGAFPAT
ncbi:hypothetical protein [Amycolatopsis alkalitolerans]|uniref:Flagellar basal body-associated protein FliL n=1 Tax=Amycolatopsis alkalitolerans TaxID=2547244 RepID=A0A5C4M6U0_9PSEU|nr:hypothetical protein [Amycolatopsis alkalitolerans]TNC27354.1 hypothetical protein FG385_09760 [Amycolatopsis alkalitolerans]